MEGSHSTGRQGKGTAVSHLPLRPFSVTVVAGFPLVASAHVSGRIRLLSLAVSYTRASIYCSLLVIIYATSHMMLSLGVCVCVVQGTQSLRADDELDRRPTIGEEDSALR
jgi:hypothetical protein